MDNRKKFDFQRKMAIYYYWNSRRQNQKKKELHLSLILKLKLEFKEMYSDEIALVVVTYKVELSNSDVDDNNSVVLYGP